MFVFVLQDLTLKHGWRTGAIIPELRKEIKIMNTEQYIHMVAWSQALTGLIEQMQVRGEKCKNVWGFFFASVLNSLVHNRSELSHQQVHRDPESQAVVREWTRERETMR